MNKPSRPLLVSAAACLFMIAAPTWAQSQSSVHPEIGEKPPKELLASDILKLPIREQQAWIHGAVSMTAQTMAKYDDSKTGCVMGWYFEGNGAEVILGAFRTYSDRHATSIVIAAANNACS